METKSVSTATKNPFVRFGRWIADVFKWLVDVEDWKLLLRSIPAILPTIFILSVVVMNLMASKTIIMTEPSWLGITGGVLLSWIPFLCMDIVSKAYGAKASIKLNILALIINLICVAFFQLIAVIQVGGDPNTYASFNATFNQTWQILIASSIAFIVSGIINSILNVSIGKMFKKNPDSKIAYATRTYVSTMIGQFVDNFVFTALAFLVFFKLSIGTSLGWTIWTVLGTSAFGAVLELAMEVIFSPIGYNVCKKWRKEEVGKQYLDYCKKMELTKDYGRVAEEESYE